MNRFNTVANKEVRMGLELEYFVVDDNFQPWNEAYKFADSLGNGFCHEFGAYQFEITSDPFFTLAEVEEDLRTKLNKCIRLLPEEKFLLPIGTYPFAFERIVTPDERLLSIVQKTNETYGFRDSFGVELETGLQSVQFNFSLSDGLLEDIFMIFNILREVIPVTVALTANSTYFFSKRITNTNNLTGLLNGEGDLELKNGRRHIWELCEGKNTIKDTGLRYGIPEIFHNYEEYKAFLFRVGAMGNRDVTSIESTVYTDIRPRTENKKGDLLGADLIRVEYRPCDMLPTLREILGVAALLKGYLISKLNKKGESRDKADLTNEAKIASHIGLVQYNGVDLFSRFRSMIFDARTNLPDNEKKYLDLFDYDYKLRTEECMKLGPIDYCRKIIEECRHDMSV